MGNYTRLRRPSAPAYQQLTFFAEEAPKLQPVTEDIIYWQNNKYRRKDGKYYQCINTNEYEVVDPYVISQVHATWINQNSTGATLFIDGEPKTPL